MTSTTRADARGSTAHPRPTDERTDGRLSRADPHPWRLAAWLTLGLIALSGAVSMVLVPAIRNQPGWWLNTEAWYPVMAGRFVAYGSYPYLYSAHEGWIAGPLLPILLAPVSYAQDRFHLSDNALFRVPYPTLWLLLAPYGLSMTALVLYAARRWFVQESPEHASGRAPARLQFAVAALVGVPVGVVFLHFEDLLALAGVLFALIALGQDRLRAGALWTGLALCSKQWAILAVPALTARATTGRRLRFLMGCAVLPAILYGIPLLVDPQDASRAIFQGRAFPMLGHAQLWVQASMPVTPTVLRVVAVLLSVVVPVVARRIGAGARVSTATILAAVFAARLVVEPVVFAYYLSPVLLFLAIEETARRASPRWTLIIGAAMLALFPVHPNVWAWWTVELGLATALVVAVYRPSLLARRVFAPS